VLWYDKLLDELDQEQLEYLCNPVHLFEVEDDTIYFFILLEDFIDD